MFGHRRREGADHPNLPPAPANLSPFFFLHHANTACFQGVLGCNLTPRTIAAQLHAAFWIDFWAPTFDIDPLPQTKPDQIGGRRRGLGHGNGRCRFCETTSKQFAMSRRLPCLPGYSSEARLRRQANRGHRPSAWRPKMPKDVLPKFSKLDALSPYRPGSALLLCPKGMAPQPLHAYRAARTLMMGRTSSGALGTHRGNSEQHDFAVPCARKHSGILGFWPRRWQQLWLQY